MKPTERPLVENTADSQQIRTARKRKKKSDELFTAAIRKVLDLPEGRLLLWEYLAYCGVFQGGRASTEELQFNAGKRDVGLRILHDIEAARPDLIQIMRHA